MKSTTPHTQLLALALGIERQLKELQYQLIALGADPDTATQLAEPARHLAPPVSSAGSLKTPGGGRNPNQRGQSALLGPADYSSDGALVLRMRRQKSGTR